MGSAPANQGTPQDCRLWRAESAARAEREMNRHGALRVIRNYLSGSGEFSYLFIYMCIYF